MLIISDFKDFYDYGCVYGIDKKYVYKRKMEVIELKKNSFYKSVIGFCGNVYNLTNLFDINVLSDTITEKEITIFNKTSHIEFKTDKKFSFTDKCQFKQYRSDWYPQKLVNKYKEDKINKEEFENKIDGHVGFIKNVKKDFWYKIQFPKEHEYIFEKYKVPIFYGFGYTLYLNPPLNKLGFQKYITPVEAFQEIEMFFTK